MEKENEKLKEFRDAIFSLNTRRFGRIAELMIKKIYKFKDSENLAYDLIDNKLKIEVKFSTVLKKCKNIINEENIITEILNSNLSNRGISYTQSENFAFDCNIQQVKVKEFDVLFYGCFFQDKIMICKIKPDQILTDKNINYSDFQHRGNNGEGQFHINNITINHHIDNYLLTWLTYSELWDLFKIQESTNSAFLNTLFLFYSILIHHILFLQSFHCMSDLAKYF